MAGKFKFDRDKVADVVAERPLQNVCLLACFACFAGVGLAVMAGPNVFDRLPPALTIYGTVTSLISTALFGWAQVVALRRSQS